MIIIKDRRTRDAGGQGKALIATHAQVYRTCTVKQLHSLISDVSRTSSAPHMALHKTLNLIVSAPRSIARNTSLAGLFVQIHVTMHCLYELIGNMVTRFHFRAFTKVA